MTFFFQKLEPKVIDPKMTFNPKSVVVKCVTLPKDHCVQVPQKYMKVCGYSDLFFKNLNQRSLTPSWPSTPCLLRSHMWLYPRIIVSKSNKNTSKYADTVTLFFKNLNQRSLNPRWPLTPCLLRSHVWLYPMIIVSKSHGNTSMYVDTDLPTVQHYVGLSHILRFPEQKCGTVSHFGNDSNGKFLTKTIEKQCKFHLKLLYSILCSVLWSFPRAWKSLKSLKSLSNFLFIDSLHTHCFGFSVPHSDFDRLAGMWIQWSILQNTTYIPHTYKHIQTIHTTYRMSDHIRLLLNTVQVRQ